MHSKLRMTTRGFTLLETLVSMAVGLTVIAAGAQLYSNAVNATWMASQRTEMQQDLRAAENMMVKDISLTATGLTGSPGGVGLVAGAGVTTPVYGCSQVSSSCYLPVSSKTGVNFPQNPSSYLYWIIPGQGLGAQVFAGQGNTDAITVAYADMNFALQCYNVSFPSNTQARFTIQSPLTPACQSPPLPQSVQLVSDNAYGLKTGDFVMFTNSSGGMAVAEVTANVTGVSSPFTVNFTSTDKLALNQTTASTGSLTQMVGGSGTTVIRLQVISYYIDIINGVPTLMRQVNGQNPVPLAENVVDLRINYDAYDSDGNLTPGVGAPPAANINSIRKVNIVHLTARSPMRGSKGYQSLDLQTSVSLRNMSFQNRYAVN